MFACVLVLLFLDVRVATSLAFSEVFKDIPNPGKALPEIPKPGKIIPHVPNPFKVLPEVPNPGNILPEVPKPGNILSEVPKPGNILSEVPKPGNILPEVQKPGNILPNVSFPKKSLFPTACVEAVGCFDMGPPFYHPVNRPLPFLPDSELKTKFLLFTPANPLDKEDIQQTTESISNSSFNPELPVKVLIHGFLTSLDEKDIRFAMKDALLKFDDYNVIVVDWTKHNSFPYAQAVANARAVGAQLGNFLKFIMEHSGVKAHNIHIIGHSLGAHISGWAGESIPGLGRITGLDPAGPYFQDAVNAVRLDATDALFVDVIHSDGGEHFMGGFGIGDPIGHMDFYPNGGRRQPGCVYSWYSDSAIGSVVNMTADLIINSCDHTRACDYFLESIDNSKCRFLATWCNSYDDFEKGDCLPQNSTLSEMGFHAERIQGVPIKSKFFLRTNATEPFCIEDSVYL